MLAAGPELCYPASLRVVTAPPGGRRREIIGREAEIDRIERFLAGSAPGRLLLVGEPGLGKTTLWESGVDAARSHGHLVLAARPSGAEAQLSFAALTDLLEQVDLASLDGIPEPQRHALEVALLRAQPKGAPVEPRAIATGLRSALRALAAERPVLIALDDAQWLDGSSSEAIAFAIRRLEDADVRCLLARRPGSATPVEEAASADEAEQLEIRPLSLGATRALLFDRLGLSLPRRVLRQVFETAGGNPLFALEIGRTLAAGDVPRIGEELPVPEAVEDLVGVRVAALEPPVRRLLLAVALSPGLRAAQLEALADPDTVEEAVETGALVLDGDRVRPSHPLLAAAARKGARARERRRLHLELACVVDHDELRARHLALSATGEAEALAPEIAAAASAAAARGARQEAAELAEQAFRLTPGDAPERGDRILALGLYLAVAGDVPRMRRLVEPALDEIPPGLPRVRACRLLCEGAETLDASRPYLERALVEAGDDEAVRAWALIEMSTDRAVLAVEAIGETGEAVEQLAAAARTVGLDAERDVLQALAWTRSLRGRPVDDVCEEFERISESAFFIAAAPIRVAGQRHVWRGEIEPARAIFIELRRQSEERGEPLSYSLQRLHLCELELRVGDFPAARRLLDEWARAPDEEAILPPMYARCRALLFACEGDPGEAARWAEEAIASGEASGIRWDILEARRARGIAALLDHDLPRAAESLRDVWEHTEREGVLDPGVFPSAPDLVETLVELGEADEAAVVTRRLRVLADEQEHPWGLATAARCEGVLELAAKRYEQAAASLSEAASRYGELGLRFDEARSRLVLGRGERRLKKWGAARSSLEQATTLFEAMGAPGWADAARSDLSRVGARRPAPAGELTPTERRIARLAADGLANKEIAQQLVVTVHTVEVHLSHAYAKLGIRSRSQLAGRL